MSPDVDASAAYVVGRILPTFVFCLITLEK